MLNAATKGLLGQKLAHYGAIQHKLRRAAEEEIKKQTSSTDHISS